MAVVEDHAGGNAAPSDRQEVKLDNSGRCAALEEAREEAAARGSALRRREETFLAPALLMQVDECFQVRDRGLRPLQLDRPGSLGPANLATDFVPLLLFEGAEVAIEIDAGREGQHGADLLLLTRHQPAAARRDPLEGGDERVRGWVSGAKAAQVHGVPARGILGGEVADDGVADARQIRRRRKNRGVVRVIRGAEEDRGRRSGHRAEDRTGLVADRRARRNVARLQLVAMHQGRYPDDLARGGLVHDDKRLVVGGVAVRVPPCPLHAVARKRGRGRRSVDESVPHLSGDGIEGAAAGNEPAPGPLPSRGLYGHSARSGRHRGAPGQHGLPAGMEGMVTPRE